LNYLLLLFCAFNEQIKEIGRIKGAKKEIKRGDIIVISDFRVGVK